MDRPAASTGRPAAPTNRPAGPTDPGRPCPSAASWPTAPPDPLLTGVDAGAVDSPHFAAAAVLDVLRASGWADAAEAGQLRAEVVRLRELLDLVIRDHRAREASAAGMENQQLYWLVPLLRAAHGVAFGTLGAKVHLRTAVQEVPPAVLASAGLSIPEHLPPERDAEH